MKSVLAISLLLATLASMIAIVPAIASTGPEMDVLRFTVLKGGIPPRPPDESIYLNAFNEWYYEWKNLPENAFGPPDGAYIEGDANAQWASLFGFEDVVLAGREIEDIQIECYAQYPHGFTEDVDIDFYGFSSTQSFAWLGSGWGTPSWDWHGVRWTDDSVLKVMPELANETELNNLELLIYNYHGDAPDVIRVDSVRLNIWYKIEEPPHAPPKLTAMLNGWLDVLPDLTQTSHIELLDEACFLITQDLGFHTGYIGFNIRADQSYRRYVSYWPLHDVHFRHALIHCYNQLGIIPPLYGYVVTPIRSLVPPAQSKYYSDNVPAHPYNPGSPFATTVWNPATGAYEDSCSILRSAGYEFVDTAPTGTVNNEDYWKCPDGSPVPFMRIFTPLAEVAPTSWQHGQEFISDLAAIGLASTPQNGNHGMAAKGWDFSDYMELVHGYADFDAYMAFSSLGRVPTQLYLRLHSSQDCYTHPGRSNAVGVNDPTIDALAEQVRFSLDPNAIETAAKTIQDRLYTPTLPNADNFALGYMMLYSRSYYNAYNNNLTGVVKSPGYGSINQWTFLNLHWKPGAERLEDGKTVVVWAIPDEPVSFNPTYAFTKCEWEILDRVSEGLTNVNPYNHYDIPWIAADWTITEVGGGMEIDFTLRDDVYWQDGYQFDASDVEFCLEFLRGYHVSRYAETWETLTDVVVTDATHVTIQADEAGLGLFYDYAGLAPLLPMQIWDRAWANDWAVLDYNPDQQAYGTDMAPGYTPGPWASEVPTNLFGTGPFTFQFYDAVNQYCDLWANQHYFMSATDIDNLMTDMFWEVGDYNRDGKVTEVDLYFVELAWGSVPGDPNWDPDADFNSDGYIGVRDAAIAAFHLLWQREYEKPPCTPDVLIQEEIDLIESWDLNAGMENSLTGKLDDALTLLEHGNINGAIHKLGDLLTKVENDAKHLTETQKDHLRDAILGIIELIESTY